MALKAWLKSSGANPQQKEKMQKAEYSWQTKLEWLLTEFLALCPTRESITKVRTVQDKRPLPSTKEQLQAASQCSQMIEKGKYILWSVIEIRLDKVHKPDTEWITDKMNSFSKSSKRIFPNEGLSAQLRSIFGVLNYLIHFVSTPRTQSEKTVKSVTILRMLCFKKIIRKLIWWF